MVILMSYLISFFFVLIGCLHYLCNLSLTDAVCFAVQLTVESINYVLAWVGES